MTIDTQVAVLGIRHHGPGSARSVWRALDALRPTAVLIEGPPELDAVASLAGSAAMRPPVAGLVYALDRPQLASFYPMAAFSPEWIALRWALDSGAEVAFADLPAANSLALDETEATPTVGTLSHDPIAALASAVGYDDPERWWEDAVEQQAPDEEPLARFDVVTDAMRAFRDGLEADGLDGPDLLTARREAAMRRRLRATIRAEHQRVAFVCGAFHAPVLQPGAWPTVKADADLLKALGKTKVAATWAPWTSGRLAYASGYGAGVAAPGWYHHLFTTADGVIARWMVRVARCLRAEQFDASAASVVEATRLAEALAAVRGRPQAGLAEVNDAAQAVLCGGSVLPLRVVARELIVGHELGHLPDETPMVPLAQDLARQQKALRLQPSAEQKTVTVDLRRPAQLARSVLFHRLALLGVHWAVPVDAGRTLGTFKEAWQLEWRPELAVDVVETSVHGTTVEAAAHQKVAADARAAGGLTALASLVERCLLAELPEALAAVLDALARRTAQQHDARALMDAVEPLARTRRYGNVRGVDTAAIHDVLVVVVTRAAVGLGAACSALDDDTAAVMRDAIESAHRGVALVDDAELRQVWEEAIEQVAGQEGVHGTIIGRLTRILHDAGRMEREEVARRLSRVLSPGNDPVGAAAWLDGLLAGDAVLLLHDPDLLTVIDGWLTTISAESFDDLLPLLRRTFAQFQKAERRQIGEHIRRIGEPRAGHAVAPDGSDPDEACDAVRAAPAVAKVAELLGLRG